MVKTRAEQEEELRAKFRAVFLSPAGAEVLQILENRFSGPTVVADRSGRVDPLNMAFREGQRCAVLFVKGLIEDRPSQEKVPEQEWYQDEIGGGFTDEEI